MKEGMRNRDILMDLDFYSNSNLCQVESIFTDENIYQKTINSILKR